MTDRPHRTFDFGEGGVSDSTFQDIQSSADILLHSPGGAQNVAADRVLHEPQHEPPHQGGIDWGKVGAIAGLVGVLVAVIFGVLTLLG